MAYITEEDVEVSGSVMTRKGPKPTSITRSKRSFDPDSSAAHAIAYARANGYFPPKPYHRSKSKLIYTSTPERFNMKYNWKTYSYEPKYLGYTELIGSFPSYPSKEVSEASRQAKFQLLASLSKNKVDVLTSIAEAKKSADTVLDGAKRVGNALYALYKLDIRAAAEYLGVIPNSRTRMLRRRQRRLIKQAKRDNPSFVPGKTDFRKLRLKDSTRLKASRFVSDAWLSYRYGWMPIVYDMDGAMQFFAEAPQPNYIRGRGQGKATVDEHFPNPNPGYGGISKRVTGSVKVVYYGWATAKANYAQFNRKLGGDIRDIPNTLWELVPGSFILDWFIPIGQYLQNLSAEVGIKFNIGCVSTKVDIAQTVSVDSGSKLGGGRHYMSERSGESTLEQFDRSTFSNLGSYPFPKMNLSDSYSPLRAADTLSLLIGAVGNRAK